MSDYTSVSVTSEARDALRRLTAAVTGEAGQRLSMSDAVLIAERIVKKHSNEIAATLAAIEAETHSPKGHK
jgi:hypothetical protein